MIIMIIFIKDKGEIIGFENFHGFFGSRIRNFYKMLFYKLYKGTQELYKSKMIKKIITIIGERINY